MVGSNKTGNIHVHKVFEKKDTHDFFAEDTGTQTVVNICKLVEEINDALVQNAVTSRKIMIVSDYLGITTKRKVAPQGTLKGKWLKKAEGADKSEVTPLIQRRLWGICIENEQKNEVYTTTYGDEFFLSSFVFEFESYGFKVLSIEDKSNAMMNLSALFQYSFDVQEKIIIDVSKEITVYTFAKDVIRDIKVWDIQEYNMIYLLMEYTNAEMMKLKSRNAVIIFSGDRFRQKEFYDTVIREYQDTGYHLCDVLGEMQDKEGIEITFEEGCISTGDYIPCIALLLKGFSGDTISMIPKIRVREKLQKHSFFLAYFAIVMATIFCVVTFGQLGVLGVKTLMKTGDIVDRTLLQSQFSVQQQNVNRAQDTLAALTQVDERITTLLDFVSTYFDKDLKIASIDTKDMLVQIEVEAVVPENDMGATEKEDEQDATNETTKKEIETAEKNESKEEKKSIVIRGYAKTSAAPIVFYDSLRQQEILVQPRMNGVEKYLLPSGEEIYIFEIEFMGVI